VLHLSFCDLSLLLHGVIFARNSSNSGLNFSNNFQCGYLQSSTQFFMTLSMYSIVAIAAHRCYGLITPGAANFDAKRNAFLFSVAWIISFAITIPVFMKSKVHQNRNEKLCSVVYSPLSESECLTLFKSGNFSIDDCPDIHNNFLSSCQSWKPPLERTYITAFLIIAFLVPTIIITVSYSIILKTVKESFRRISRIGNSTNQKAQQSVSLMAILFFVSALISFGPHAAYLLIKTSQMSLTHQACDIFKSISESLVVESHRQCITLFLCWQKIPGRLFSLLWV